MNTQPHPAPTGSPEHLADWSAVRLAGAIASGEVSAVEVMRAHLERIEERNPVINAVVSQQPDSVSLRAAEEADKRRAAGDELPPLHGLPTAVKDLMDVAGFPTTNGSAAFADAAPAAHDSVLATLLRDAGAIIIGKTNTPEMGQGVLSFNPVFGTTVNPWDVERHAGGSSGGAAAALAARMLPIADGSDSGGSLRYPAAFCNVVGVRPSPGRVPSGRTGNAWTPHGVSGPMARDSADAALFLEALAVEKSVWPLSSLPSHPAEAVELQGLRIGWSADAGGLPVDPAVRAVHSAFAEQLASLGAIVEADEPDFAGADEAWETIETFEFFLGGRHAVDAGASGFRPDYVRNVEQGRAMTATALADAYERRTRAYRDTAALLERHDVLILPATPVVAPPADLEWVEEVDGVRFDRYFQWQMMANRLTLTAHPVVVTSAGFTPEGLPVGVQVVGRHGREAQLLAVTRAIEEATGWISHAPSYPYPSGR
ncbi:amidase family protein [Salinibacterium sp. SYSU T00001]|uniref:amidase n=1 Tax=Homoserinimonas sedimenticola TaxID=2986805 RepID=UPI002235C5D2|nr:amidase family protein [Salinibacterium sedimenticola]MCW4385930.1 amidase family protein [Salinibacterium sedimenticola]